MKRKHTIERIIFVLVLIKIGLVVIFLNLQENIFSNVVFGKPVYAQVKETSSNKKAAKNEKVTGQAAIGQLDMEILKSFEQKRQDQQKREEALKKREDQLHLLQAEIEQKLNEIKKVQSKIEQMITVREDIVDKSIKHLVKVYSSMKPAEAGPLIEKLDKEITIQILSRMKGKSAGKILARVNPTLAAQLSEEMAKKK